jgi:hypothetical protein
MTRVTDSPDRSRVLEELREELADEFVRAVARDEAPRPKRRVLGGRRRLVAFGVALLLVPVSLAVANGLQGTDSTTFEELQAFDEAGLSWDGENIRLDGEIVDCPVDEALREELGLDPCAIVPSTPAPAPLNELNER